MPDYIPQTKEATHTTTITIPVSMANWVVGEDMTYSGAFKQGIKAMQERKTWNQQMEELKGMSQRQIQSLKERLRAAEIKLKSVGEQLESQE